MTRLITCESWPLVILHDRIHRSSVCVVACAPTLLRMTISVFYVARSPALSIGSPEEHMRLGRFQYRHAASSLRPDQGRHLLYSLNHKCGLIEMDPVRAFIGDDVSALAGVDRN